jgi:hypothetical protein
VRGETAVFYICTSAENAQKFLSPEMRSIICTLAQRDATAEAHINTRRHGESLKSYLIHCSGGPENFLSHYVLFLFEQMRRLMSNKCALILFEMALNNSKIYLKRSQECVSLIYLKSLSLETHLNPQGYVLCRSLAKKSVL